MELVVFPEMSSDDGDDWPEGYDRGSVEWHAYQRGWRGYHRDRAEAAAWRNWIG